MSDRAYSVNAGAGFDAKHVEIRNRFGRPGMCITLMDEFTAVSLWRHYLDLTGKPS
jgi:AAA+ superfamily predicted ATPase